MSRENISPRGNIKSPRGIGLDVCWSKCRICPFASSYYDGVLQGPEFHVLSILYNFSLFSVHFVAFWACFCVNLIGKCLLRWAIWVTPISLYASLHMSVDAYVHCQETFFIIFIQFASRLPISKGVFYTDCTRRCSLRCICVDDCEVFLILGVIPEEVMKRCSSLYFVPCSFVSIGIYT